MEQNMGKAANKQVDLNAQNSLRFERKFIYKNTRAEDLIQTEILTNPFCFKEVYHRRSINNIYFDDHDLTFYKQNVRRSRRCPTVRTRPAPHCRTRAV